MYRALRYHGHRTEARARFTALLKSDDAFARAEGYWDAKSVHEEANEQFRTAYKEGKNSPAVRVSGVVCPWKRFNPAGGAQQQTSSKKLSG